MDDGTDDPGWSRAVRRGALALVPIVGHRLSRHGEPAPALVGLRVTFVAFSAALAWVALIIVLVWSRDPGAQEAAPSVGASATVVALAGIGSIAAGTAFRRRPMKCDSDEAVARAFANRFFVGIAFAEIAALVGFVATILSESTTPGLVGAAITACGFAIVAPTRSEVDRAQDRLKLQGCNRSLSTALLQPPTRSRPR